MSIVQQIVQEIADSLFKNPNKSRQFTNAEGDDMWLSKSGFEGMYHGCESFGDIYYHFNRTHSEAASFWGMLRRSEKFCRLFGDAASEEAYSNDDGDMETPQHWDVLLDEYRKRGLGNDDLDIISI